ncbi:hypothetical protein HBM95_23175 [Enterobacter asburiae]|nr:hypothetical protein [Enterobacter asburiae]
MDYRSLMKNSFSEMRKYSSQTVMVTQSFTSFGRYKPRPAFQDWIKRLNKNDRLPRGRFFAGKKPGRRLAIFDEI